MSMDSFWKSLATAVLQKGFDLSSTLEKDLNRKRNQERLLELIPLVLNNNDLINQIKSEFSIKNSPSDLVHDITTSLCITYFQNGTFNQDLFRTKCSILKPFINKNNELELDCLKAVQLVEDKLDETHSSFIRKVFDSFSDCFIIREGTFYKWKNIQETQGNMKSLQHLKEFFTKEYQQERFKRRLPNWESQSTTQASSDIMTRKKQNESNKKHTISTQVDLNRLVQIFNEHDSNETLLLEKLKTEFNNKLTLNKKNMHTLIDALCASCIDSSSKQFKLTFFNRRCLVLKHFINTNEAMEIETLKQIQVHLSQVDSKIPGFEQVIFFYLKENSIVSEKALEVFANPEFSANEKQKSNENSKKEKAKFNKKLPDFTSYNVKSAKWQDQTSNYHGKTKAFIEAKMNYIFGNYSLTPNEIVVKLQDEFTEYERGSKYFINDLVTAFLKSCLHGVHCNTELVRTRCTLLSPFLARHRYAQSDALSSVVSFCQNIASNNNLIGILFDVLYMEKVINEGAFFNWRSRADDQTKDLLREFFHKLSQNNRTVLSRDSSSSSKLSEKSSFRKPNYPNSNKDSNNNTKKFSNRNHQHIQHQAQVKQFIAPVTSQFIQPVQAPVMSVVPQIPVQYYMPVAQPPVMAASYTAPQLSTNFVAPNQPPLNDKKKQFRYSKPHQFFKPTTDMELQETSKKFNQMKLNSSSNQLIKPSSSPEPSCPICIETISNLKTSKTRLVSTQCGHILCKPCAEKLFSKSNYIECPMCRTSLMKHSVHDLFI